MIPVSGPPLRSCLICTLALVYYLLTACTFGPKVPSGELDPPAERAWQQCESLVNAKVGSAYWWRYQAYDAALEKCMNSQGYTLIENN
jgi:hypothetical protein